MAKPLNYSLSLRRIPEPRKTNYYVSVRGKNAKIKTRQMTTCECRIHLTTNGFSYDSILLKTLSLTRFRVPKNVYNSLQIFENFSRSHFKIPFSVRTIRSHLPDQQMGRKAHCRPVSPIVNMDRRHGGAPLIFLNNTKELLRQSCSRIPFTNQSFTRITRRTPSCTLSP